MGFFRGSALRMAHCIDCFKQHALRTTILFCLLFTGCIVQSVTEPHTFDPELEPTPVPTAVSVAKPTYTAARGTVSRT